MAKLFPKLDPAEIINPGECLIATGLVQQLPREIEIFHSFQWLGVDRQGTVQEFEADFLVLSPSEGLLIVEVKGGELEFDGERVQWRRRLPSGRTRILENDPFAQARTNMHGIVERIRAQLPGKPAQLPFPFGYAVAFPDTALQGELPASIVPDLLFDAAKCKDLQASIARAFRRFRRSTSTISPQVLKAVHNALYPRYALVPVIWRKVEDQEERLRRMTSGQQQLLEFLALHRKAAISGGAGSGKTLLAIAKAQECARQGLRTLLVCYNKELKIWLNDAIASAGLAGELVVDTYHGLVGTMCRRAGVAFDPDTAVNKRAFWSDTAPELLMQACESLGDDAKFDAIIVDEGQDFRELWFASLDDVFRDPANKLYYVFFDGNQTIYVDAPAIPAELGPPFPLPTNCRNTISIAEHCARLIGTTAKTRDGAPIGDAPDVVRARSIRDGFQLAGERVREWCAPAAGRGLERHQVAILAPGSTESFWPTKIEPARGLPAGPADVGGKTNTNGTGRQPIPLTKDFDAWRRGDAVLIASWARFKGLEADAVVTVEPPARSQGDQANQHELAEHYVARSRAKHLLTVIEVG